MRNIPRSLDHLSGLARRKSLQYQAELGLKEAFQSLAGKKEEANKESVEKVGARIAYGLAKVSFERHFDKKIFYSSLLLSVFRIRNHGS